MEYFIFYVMIIIVCVFDPWCDIHTSTGYFKYNRNLDKFLSWFRWLYRKEWRDSYHQICWHWLKWIRFYTPFIAYIIVAGIFWVDVILGAVFGKFIWRLMYDYYSSKKERL